MTRKFPIEMSLPHPMFGPNQLNSLFYAIAEYIRTDPFKCLAVLVLLLIGYTFRRFVTPSVYPNIDGPARGHIIFGTRSRCTVDQLQIN